VIIDDELVLLGPVDVDDSRWRERRRRRKNFRLVSRGGRAAIVDGDQSRAA
jgi:hypothetical protein